LCAIALNQVGLVLLPSRQYHQRSEADSATSYPSKAFMKSTNEAGFANVEVVSRIRF